jgi:acylglycerol lipase
LTQAKENLPLYIYGHSMGGLITMKLLLERPHIKITAFVLTSPFLDMPKDRHIPKAKIFIVKKLGDDLEDLILNAMINPTALTKNNKYMHKIFEDRLMIPFLSVKMAKSMFDSVDWIKEHMDNFNKPVIVFHGKKDSLINYEASKLFVERKVSQFKRLHLFDEGYHELQHDEEKD